MKRQRSRVARVLMYVAGMILLLVALYCVRLAYLAKTTAAADGFGSGQGSMLCAVNRPNCVSSANTERDFAISPLVLASPSDQAMQHIKDAILQEPRAQVVYSDANRIEASFRSRLFGFPDDAIFQLDANSGQIQILSRSRVGYSDLGVNRARLERIRQRVTTP